MFLDIHKTKHLSKIIIIDNSIIIKKKISTQNRAWFKESHLNLTYKIIIAIT